MWRTLTRYLVIWAGIVTIVVGLVACADGGAEDGEAADRPVGEVGGDTEAVAGIDEHDEGEEMAGEHAEEGHAIPEEAAELENPTEVTEASIEAGAAVFSANCVVCHGTEGQGDGPSAESLDPPPAALGEDHVQVLTDGELFWVITHGVEGTGMPAWEAVLSEDERWQVVNFIRTFQ